MDVAIDFEALLKEERKKNYDRKKKERDERRESEGGTNETKKNGEVPSETKECDSKTYGGKKEENERVNANEMNKFLSFFKDLKFFDVSSMQLFNYFQNYLDLGEEKELMVIDLREKEEWSASHIRGAVHYTQFASEVVKGKNRKVKKLVLYDTDDVEKIDEGFLNDTSFFFRSSKEDMCKKNSSFCTNVSTSSPGERSLVNCNKSDSSNSNHADDCSCNHNSCHNNNTILYNQNSGNKHTCKDTSSRNDGDNCNVKHQNELMRQREKTNKKKVLLNFFLSIYTSECIFNIFREQGFRLSLLLGGFSVYVQKYNFLCLSEEDEKTDIFDIISTTLKKTNGEDQQRLFKIEEEKDNDDDKKDETEQIGEKGERREGSSGGSASSSNIYTDNTKRDTTNINAEREKQVTACREEEEVHSKKTKNTHRINKRIQAYMSYPIEYLHNEIYVGTLIHANSRAVLNSLNINTLIDLTLPVDDDRNTCIPNNRNEKVIYDEKNNIYLDISSCYFNRNKAFLQENGIRYIHVEKRPNEYNISKLGFDLFEVLRLLIVLTDPSSVHPLIRYSSSSSSSSHDDAQVKEFTTNSRHEDNADGAFCASDSTAIDTKDKAGGNYRNCVERTLHNHFPATPSKHTILIFGDKGLNESAFLVLCAYICITKDVDAMTSLAYVKKQKTDFTFSSNFFQILSNFLRQYEISDFFKNS